MRFVNPFRFVLAAVITVQSVIGAPDELMVRRWQTQDGLPQNTVNAIHQTRDGFLWVGTNSGLARFDGVRFRKYGIQDGLRAIRITSLGEDRDGVLWIGTNGGGLSKWERGHITTLAPEMGLPPDADTLAIVAGHEGVLWLGTQKGLFRMSGRSIQPVGEEAGIPRKQIRALVEDAQGNLWASVLMEGLYRGTQGRFTRVEAAPGSLRGVYTLWADRDHESIWAGEANLMWHGSEGVWKKYDQAAGVPKANIVALAQSMDGSLWLGSSSQGLYQLSEDGISAFGSKLIDRKVHSLLVDTEGSTWVGTVGGGLIRLSERFLRHLDADPSLDLENVTTVTEDSSGVLWLGTGDSGLYRYEAGRVSKVQDPVVASNQIFIYCTTTTSDGCVWAAGEQVLYRFEPGHPTKAYREAPIAGEAIRALCADGETLWLGTYYSTLLKCDKEGVKVVAPSGSFGGSITSMVCEASNTLWIGSSGGLYRWEHGRVKTWNIRDGLLTNSILALHLDTDGALWIGTHGGGLARLKDDRIVNITTRQGLVDDVILQILSDDFGNLWLGSDHGIMRLEKRDLEAFVEGKDSEVHPVALGVNEGMLKEQCRGGYSPTAVKAKDGRLWFPSAGGPVVADPRRFQDLAKTAPTPSIEDIFVDGKSVSSVSSELKISPGVHRLEVRYTAPFLKGGEWLRFRHKLEGLDDGWVSARDRQAAYDGLSPGDYVLRIESSDNSGHWNPSGAMLAIRVQPYLWQRTWFHLVGILMFIGLGMAATWWHLHHKHQMQLAELERKRQRQAELAHFNRVTTMGQLAAALAHELNQPLGAILRNAEAAEMYLRNPNIDLEEMRLIIDDIRKDDMRAGAVIDRLRAMLKRRDIESRPLVAAELLTEVKDLARAGAFTRHVEIQIDAEPELPAVLGDRIQLQQVLLNLVLNAMDAMADMEREKIVKMAGLRSDHGMVELSVSDNGPGIPKEKLPNIFAPFFTTKPNGMGMGLAISHTIVESHGGRIWAENNSQHGATFRILLPAEGGVSEKSEGGAV